MQTKYRHHQNPSLSSFSNATRCSSLPFSSQNSVEIGSPYCDFNKTVFMMKEPAVRRAAAGEVL